MSHPRASRAGFTLIEMLTYGVVLAVIVNLCATLFLSARRMYSLSELSVTRMEALRDVESDLREAAAGANAVVAGVPGATLSNVVLALRAGDAGEALTYTVWRLGDPGALIFERYESEDGTLAITAQRGYAIGVTAAAAEPLGDEIPAVQMTVSVDNEGTAHTVPGTNTFVARLGGVER